MPIQRSFPLLPLLLLLLARPCPACFSGQRQTAKVNENPMTEWSQWSECSLPCGDGKQTRGRSSVVLPDEREIQSQSCGASCSETFAWSGWQEWTNCSATCGTQGVRSRFRDCGRISDGSVETRRVACPGEWMQAEACNVFSCPIVYFWMPWSAWGPCSGTCGPEGQQSRDRQCSASTLELASPENCSSLEPVSNETRPCNVDVPCPYLPDWQAWSEWSSCPVTCGPGTVTRKRERRCGLGDQRTGGACIEPDVVMETDKRDCGNPDCPPVNGIWNHWNPWSPCLKTCGWGIRVRNRHCNNPPPSNGGRDCTGMSAGQEACLGGECAVDGGWGTWSPCPTIAGGHCVTSPRDRCKQGFAMFCRQCDNPVPQFGGSPCITGLATDRRDCWNTDACDNSIVQPPMSFTVVGFLNTSDLLVTWIRAPYGIPASSFFLTWTVSGMDIVGDTMVPVSQADQQNILGESYHHWIRGLALKSVVDVSIATHSTAGGLLKASRPLTEKFTVSRVDGGWGPWGSYSSCSPTSDCNIPGTYRRSRVCNNPEPANGGLPCHGSDSETSRCFHPC